MIFLFTAPLSVGAQVLQAPPADAKRFVLFIHAGTATKPDQDLVKKVTFALAARGYVVRSPEYDRDELGGPGVDYFADADLQAATDVAAVVNAELSPAIKLKPRLQRVRNQPGYIGVWLF
jgi:hypothetical protein